MSERHTGEEPTSTLDQILEADAVEVVETTETVDSEAFDSWQEAVREQRNRAVAGVVRDAAGRVLLVQYRSDGRHTDWRLPGSPVGNVTAFEQRLESELRDQFAVPVETVSPVRVHAHTAKHGDERATFYYVLCDVAFDSPPAETFRDVRPENIEVEWFERPPENLVNPDVVPPLFGADNE